MRIEYEDGQILVIYKEAGLPVQTGRATHKDLVSLLKNHLARQQEGAGEPYLGIIHRLDQPVEGLLVFAKTPKSAAVLSAQAAAKTEMGKLYQAAVCLEPSSYPLAIGAMKKEAVLTDWLGRDRGTNTAFIASEGERDAKRAELVFRTRWVRDARALLEIRLHTGRHHQIRVQMAHAGMPLLGDRKYGSPVREEGYPLCLCASRLSFHHPVTKKEMVFHTEPSWLPLVAKDVNMDDNLA